MSGLEVAQAILKGTSTAIKILSTIKRHVDEDKRATKLVRCAKRKVTDIIDTISQNTAAIDENNQLHSIMLKCTKEMNRLNRELAKLCDSISSKVAPLRVADAIATAEQLDRILFELAILETRIENCCTTAVSMSSQLNESDMIMTLIQTKNKPSVSANDVQVLDAHGAAFYGGSNETMQMMRTELVFVPTLKLSAKDTRILQKYGDLGSVPIVDSFVTAADYLINSENFNEAMRFLQLASNLGSSIARYSMGLRKESDEVDYRGAVEHYLIAFQMGGQRFAMVKVASIYLNGMLGSKKRSKRVEYLEKGAQAGDEDCSALLAVCKLIGVGTEKNGPEAFRMAKVAESHGMMQVVLGACHFYGIGTPKDAARSEPKYEAECRKWTRKAADLGNCWLQSEYAIDCANGRYGETNMSDAYWYYRLAAKQGCARSQLEVARLYIDGVGVSRDLNKAKYYIKLASLSKQDDTVQEVRKLRKLIKS